MLLNRIEDCPLTSTIQQTGVTTVASQVPLLAPAATPGLGAGLIPVGAPVVPAGAHVETVGIGKEYGTISAAVAAATNGTVILVDAGTYTNDFSTITSSVTIEGVGGMVNLVATEPPPNLKGIITVDNSATIENVSFSGASIPDADGGNGAGIRYEGGQLNLVNDKFSHNEDGILANAVIPSLATNTITANHCLFQDNGSGSGYTHNIYIGDIQGFTLENSVSEGAVVGHEVKSRAQINNITNNVIEDGPTGTASYSIDLPNGGVDTVTNNLIEKGPHAQNDAIVHFGGEGIPYAGSSLSVSGNKFVNDLGGQAVAVLNQTAISAAINGNMFDNIAAGQIVQGPATGNGNVDGNGRALPAINATGVLPGNTLTILASDASAHAVTLDGNYGAVQDLGTGHLTVDDRAGHVIVIGGAGGLQVTEAPGTGGSSFTTAAGSTNVLTLVGQDLIDSQGHDTINTGNGNLTVQVNGTAQINDGLGGNQVAVNGTVTSSEAGSNTIYAVGTAGHLSVTGNDIYTQIQNNGGSASVAITQNGVAEALSIVGGADLLTIYGGAMHVTTSGGAQGSTIDVGAGTANIISAGPDVIHAGSGADSVIVEGKAAIYAGPGTLAVFGRGASGATVYGNGGTITLDGDTGDITYQGGAKASTVNLRLSNNTLVGGAGRLTVLGGSRETLDGGSGGLVYDATDGGGANTISTAAGATDTLTLAGADTVISRGIDTIDAGSANQSLSIYGQALINGSTGTSSLTVVGHAYLAGRGQDNVTVDAGATFIARAGLLTNVNETGATVAFGLASSSSAYDVAVRGGSASISGGSTQGTQVSTQSGFSTSVALVSGSASVQADGTDTIVAVRGSDTIDAGGPRTSISAGAADLVVNDYVPATTDTISLVGGSGSLTYHGGNASLSFIGGSGAATIDGGWNAMAIAGGAGNLVVNSGSAATVFTAGAGVAAVTLAASGGVVTFGTGQTTINEAGYGHADIFRFVAGKGGGTDLINGFQIGTDHLLLQGVTVASQQVVAGSTNITLSDHTTLHLSGVAGGSKLFG